MENDEFLIIDFTGIRRKEFFYKKHKSSTVLCVFHQKNMFFLQIFCSCNFFLINDTCGANKITKLFVTENVIFIMSKFKMILLNSNYTVKCMVDIVNMRMH